MKLKGAPFPVQAIEDAIANNVDQPYRLCPMEETYRNDKGCGDCRCFDAEDGREVFHAPQGDKVFTDEDMYAFCYYRRALLRDAFGGEAT